MTHLEKIVEYARTTAHHARQAENTDAGHASFHELVLAHGRVFEPAPLPDTVYPALPGHRFKAAMILSDHHGLVYVEGLALLPDTQTVIEHAWCSTWLGHVVDPGLGGDTAAAYLGIPFTLEFRRQAVARANGTWSVLLADPDLRRTPNRDILLHGLTAKATVPLVGTPLSGLIQPASINPAPDTPGPGTWISFATAGGYENPWTAPCASPPATRCTEHDGRDTRAATPTPRARELVAAEP